MEDICKTARLYYNESSEDDKIAALNLFRSLDYNNDGKVSLHELLSFMQKEGHMKMSSPHFFKDLDKDGSETLKFEEVMALDYIIKSGRPFCRGCKEFIPGMYFTCPICFENGDNSFCVCPKCFEGEHFVHEHYRFLDNYALLEAKRLAGIANHSNQHKPSSSVTIAELPTCTTNDVAPCEPQPVVQRGLKDEVTAFSKNMSSLEREDFAENRLGPTELERLVSGISGVIQPEESCRCFSLDEVLISTNNFDEALVIGKGGFGMVYKGFIDDGAMIVAIKRLNAESKQGAGEFWTEVMMLPKLLHTNLVGLIGHCNERQEMILVYEYIAQGTLASHLYRIGRPASGTSISPLTWEQRLDICIDAARGLNYLHSGTDRTFIHRDVKTTNILLDENWVAKISDFGLSKGTKSHLTTHISTKVKGTFGYFDPDYFRTERLTTKSDVYAFGVVLLEVLCGRPALDTSLEEEQISLVDWVQHCIEKKKLDRVIDPSLDKQISPRCLKSFVGLVVNCLQMRPRSRPSMAEVLRSLELALVSQQKGRSNGIGLEVATGIVLLYDKLKGIKFLW